MSGFVERQFDSGDVAINVAERADNGPPLLFIRGAGCPLDQWFMKYPGYMHCDALGRKFLCFEYGQDILARAFLQTDGQGV